MPISPTGDAVDILPCKAGEGDRRSRWWGRPHAHPSRPSSRRMSRTLLEWSSTLPHRGEGSGARSDSDVAKLGRGVTHTRSGLFAPPPTSARPVGQAPARVGGKSRQTDPAEAYTLAPTTGRPPSPLRGEGRPDLGHALRAYRVRGAALTSRVMASQRVASRRVQATTASPLIRPSATFSPEGRREVCRSHSGVVAKLYFTLTPAPNPFAPNANPRLFGKDIPVPSGRAYSPLIRFARTKSTANDA